MVWILILLSFLVGLLSAFTPRRSAVVVTVVWTAGILLVALLTYWLLPAGLPEGDLGLSILGAFAAFVTAFACHDLLTVVRKGRKKSV